MGFLSKRSRLAPTPAPANDQRVPGKEDLARAGSLLAAIEEALGGPDAPLRASVRAFSQAAGGTDPWLASSLDADLNRPWVWLAGVCEIAEPSGDLAIAPRAFLFANWWAGLGPQLTINDYGDMWLQPLKPAERGVITTCALIALNKLPGSHLVLATGRQMLDAGAVRNMALAELRDLTQLQVRLPVAAGPYAAEVPPAIDDALLADLALYGRGHFADFAPDVDPAMWVETEIAKRVMTFRAEFTHALLEQAAHTGGWTSVGAVRALVLIDAVAAHATEAAPALDAALLHMRARGIPPIFVNGYEWDRWRTISDGDPWLTLTPAPARDAYPVTPLAPGGERHVATLTYAPGSNRILARRDGDEYVAVVDAAWSTDDPTRHRSEHHRAATLQDLYVLVGDGLQFPPAWKTEEFIPFDRCPPIDLTP